MEPAGESLNGFIGRAISETMERDGAGSRRSHRGGRSRLHSTGAVETQAQRDALARKMGINPAQGANWKRRRKAMALPAEKQRYTFADVLTWEENDRIELIDGEAYMMALPSRIHQKISGEIFRQLANY